MGARESKTLIILEAVVFQMWSISEFVNAKDYLNSSNLKVNSFWFMPSIFL